MIAVLAPSPAPFYGGFNEGLRSIGYVEGQNIDVLYKYAGGDLARLRGLAEETIQLAPEVIVASVTTAAHAAKQLTSTIPIVGARLIAPVELGLVEALGRPGGNVTGILGSVPGLLGKQLELLRDLAPSARAVGILFNPANPQNELQLREINVSIPELLPLPIGSPQQVERLYEAMKEQGITALIVMPDPMLFQIRHPIRELAARYSLPIMYSLREHVEEGGLISYAINRRDNFRRAAYFVDMILKGRQPAEIPVELPSKFELVINTRAAKLIGISPPEAFLIRADEVIE